MTTSVLFGKEARDKVKAGIDKAVNLVKQTLGPNGRNILIKPSFNSQGYGLQYLPTSYTKDGWTVIRNLSLPDGVENMGCDLVKEASGQTVMAAGDATTCTAVLLQAIVNAGLELVDAGANPMEIKRGIDEAVKEVVIELKGIAIPIAENIERIKQIATISANNDSFIGNLIGDAFEKIGKDGIIDIEQSKSAITEIKVTEGIKINKGWLSPYFINNPAKHEAELIEPYILLYDKKISYIESTSANIDAIGKIAEQIMNAGASLLVICEDMDGAALAAMAMNTYGGKLKSCVIRCPEGAGLQREIMEDLAILVGAEYISTEKGTSLNKAVIAQLGRADKVVVSQTQTTIVSPKGNKEKLNELISRLKEDVNEVDPVEKEKIEKRIATLTGAAAVLYVGAPTETEAKEKADRCDDAYRAVKASISEGAAIGGGTALLNCHITVDGAITDFNKGKMIIGQILSKPLEQICLNAGIDAANIIAEIRNAPDNFGYNGKTGKVEDLLEAGILDSTKALRCALENAASAAGAVITSEGLIV